MAEKQPIQLKASKAMIEAGLTTGSRFGEKAMAEIWRRMAEAANKESK